MKKTDPGKLSLVSVPPLLAKQLRRPLLTLLLLALVGQCLCDSVPGGQLGGLDCLAVLRSTDWR